MIENVPAGKWERIIPLRNAFCQEDPYILQKTAQELRETYAEKWPRQELVARVLIQGTKDVGYSLLEVVGEMGWVREIFVLPGERQVATYLALLEDAIEVFAQYAVKQLRHICPEQPLECTAAFCEADFELEREHVQMEMPLQEIYAVPPPLKVKSFGELGDAAWLEQWIAFCTGECIYFRPEIEHWMKGEKGFAFVAFVDDAPAGFMISEANAWQGGQERPTVLYIEQMAVAPAYRMQGVATRMLDLVFRQGLARGLLTARLHVFNTNDPAYRLYEKLGFVEVKRVNHWALSVE